jgi:hypothetical protein
MGELIPDFPRYCDRCGAELETRVDAERVKYTRSSDSQVTYGWECAGECGRLPMYDANGFTPFNAEGN